MKVTILCLSFLALLFVSVSATVHLRHLRNTKGPKPEFHEDSVFKNSKRVVFPRFKALIRAAVEKPWTSDDNEETGLQFVTPERGKPSLMELMDGMFPHSMELLKDGSAHDGTEPNNQVNKNLRSQLQRDGRGAAVRHFLVGYTLMVQRKVEAVDATDKKASHRLLKVGDNLLYAILHVLFMESATDPPYFVSHAADHGARVMKLCKEQLVPAFGRDAVKSAVETLIPDLTTKSPYTDSWFVVLNLMNLVHDSGYYRLPRPLDITSPLKWIHAINGAELVRAELGYAGVTEFIGEQAFQHIVRAIRFHNADSGKCAALTAGIPTDAKCKFPKDSLDFGGFAGYLDARDTAKEAVRHYVPTVFETDPLLFLLRMADNMDAARARLTLDQRTPALYSCWARMYADGPLRAKKGSDTTTKGEILTRELAIKKDNDYCKVGGNAALKAALVDAAAVDRMSFLHYYSNFVVDKTEMAANGDSLDFTVTFNTDLASGKGFDIKDFTMPALYQIYRFCEAMDSATYKTKNVNSVIKVKLVNFAWPDGTDNSVKNAAYELGQFCPQMAKLKKTWATNFTKYFGRIDANCYKGDDVKKNDSTDPCIDLNFGLEAVSTTPADDSAAVPAKALNAAFSLATRPWGRDATTVFTG